MNLKKNDDNELRAWALGLLQAIRAVCQEKAEQPLFDEVIGYFEQLIQDARTDSRLKNVVKEIELWSINLDPADSEEVNRIMIAKFGKSVGEDIIFRKVDTVIKRGLIKNKGEYSLFVEILNLYSDDISKKEIVASVTEMVFQFEKKHMKK